jgi:hypothetical protein
MNENCHDFNDIMAVSRQNGSFYSCPKDGVRCTKPFHRSSLIGTSSSSEWKNFVSWNDMLIMIIYSTAKRNDVIYWWLNRFYPLPRNHLSLVIFANSCHGNNPCVDAADKLKESLESRYSFIQATVVRGLQHDTGYLRLACKMLTCMLKTYNLFPNKKYYFKIDDDTVIVPHRLLQLVNSAHSAISPQFPLYIGSILNDHRRFLLCDVPAGDRSRERLCYAQGGGGYILNHAAFKLFNNTVPNWPCTKDMDLERSDEDAYIALRLHKEQNVTVVHCGGFIPHARQSELHFADAITFHHVNALWLKQHENITFIKTNLH